MGYAYLPDGRRMLYEEYLHTPEWRQKKLNRLAFDCWQCAICHLPIGPDTPYETHHLDYSRCGNENVEHDIITVCPRCHKGFHSRWTRQEYWDSPGEPPLEHWKNYSLQDTAALCHQYLQKDYWFGGEYNMCAIDTIHGFIDQYFIDNSIAGGVILFEDDIRLYFRNRRYDLILASAAAKEPMDAMLDRMFGEKHQKGGNKRRSEARTFYTKHKIPSIKRIYKENENILILMDEVKKLEEKEHE